MNDRLNYLFVIIIVLTLIISLLAIYNKKYRDLIVVQSTIDNNDYLVQNLPDCLEASNTLARMKNMSALLLKHLNTKYPDKSEIHFLSSNFRPDCFSEKSSYQYGTSYSLNKGEQIVLCLRQADTGQFVDQNTLIFVTIHELAHLATDEQGHTEKFKENFILLLNEAMNLGLYNYTPYHKVPEKYCGKLIQDTPLK
jgi:hypothetical protein